MPGCDATQRHAISGKLWTILPQLHRMSYKMHPDNAFGSTDFPLITGQKLRFAGHSSHFAMTRRLRFNLATQKQKRLTVSAHRD